MKRKLKVIACLLIVFLCIPYIMVSAAPDIPAKEEMRGLWVASVVNIDYPSKPTTDPEVLKSEALKVLDYASETGFNAVFLQVRPTADALYKSNYFPWSKYLTGSQGLAPQDGCDPLEYWVSEAHKRGIQLHAWINPYRITKRKDGEPKYDFSSLDPSNPAVLNPQWVVKYSDGNLYFDPGIPEVRKLIVDSVLEIINNYGIDGIHLDDYFYPGEDFNDKATFNTYGNGYSDINEWRRANVNTLVSGLSNAIRAAGKNVSFGISPFGIWANKKHNSLGSDTNGGESYYQNYADTRKWVKEGLLDYIAPQLYWYIGFSAADYSKLISWWSNTVRGTGVDLYIGQAAYLEGNPNPSSPWYGTAEIERQMRLNAKTPEVKGSIFFNYNTLADNPALSAVIKATYEQRDNIVSSTPVIISRPSENIKTSFSKFYLNGASDPTKPLYLNGKEVTDRSQQGYFGVLVPLENGENTFTFSQEGSFATRVIYRLPSSGTPDKMSSAAIPISSVFPQSQEYRMPGEKITLYCQAPIGSKVSVRVGNKVYQMNPSTTTSYGQGIYPATFTCSYTIPVYTGVSRNIDLGKPAYTMKYNGVTKTYTAPAKIGVIMKNLPFFARVTKDVIDTYDTPSSEDGAAYELYKGMVDYVTGMTDGYVRLSSGQWVKKGNVETYMGKLQLRPSIKKAVYTTGDKWDSLKLDISASFAVTSSFDGNSVKLNISSASSAPIPVLPGNSMFSSITATRNGYRVEYKLTLKAGQSIEGYYVEKTQAGLTLRVKRPVKVLNGSMPLSGITIMLDPGHGGSETGTVGPLGLNYPEKDINLKTALKLKTELEKAGAKVLMTRAADKTVSLVERLAASRDARPDMFLSIHANSMEDNVDMTQVQGFSVFYREVLAKAAADAVLKNGTGALGLKNMGVSRRNFYVTRGTWTPSILIETGFVPNPREFEWLTDESQQSVLAANIKDAIVKYFSR